METVKIPETAIPTFGLPGVRLGAAIYKAKPPKTEPVCDIDGDPLSDCNDDIIYAKSA